MEWYDLTEEYADKLFGDDTLSYPNSEDGERPAYSDDMADETGDTPTMDDTTLDVSDRTNNDPLTRGGAITADDNTGATQHRDAEQGKMDDNAAPTMDDEMTAVDYHKNAG